MKRIDPELAAKSALRWWCSLDVSSRSDIAGQAGISYDYLYLLTHQYRRPSPELAERLDELTGGRLDMLTLLSVEPRYKRRQATAEA